MNMGHSITISIPKVTFTLTFERIDREGAYVFSANPDFHGLPDSWRSEVLRRLKEEAINLTKNDFGVGREVLAGHKVIAGHDFIFAAIGI